MNQMRNIKQIMSLTAVLASLSACDSSDMPVQHADHYNDIRFTVETQKSTTRANEYEKYDPTQHPLTMGVFGYHHDTYNTTLGALGTALFNNSSISYNQTSLSWEYGEPKKWEDYKEAFHFGFFAYMPHQTGSASGTTASSAPGITVTTDAGNHTATYTLAVPFNMPAATPLLFNTQELPIICALPENRDVKSETGEKLSFEHTVKFKFDQTLIGYKLFFKLDPTMGAIRQFRIKKVGISGNIHTGGTVTRDYTYQATSKEWTAGKITWTDLLNQEFSTENAIDIPNSSTPPASSLPILSTEYSQWGETFYTIPDKNFTPAIHVTYDVEMVAQDSSTVVTRKDVTSTILLNKQNFGSMNTTSTATINSVRILIQPRYLYVMSDQDAYTGHLLID